MDKMIPMGTRTFGIEIQIQDPDRHFLDVTSSVSSHDVEGFESSDNHKSC